MQTYRLGARIGDFETIEFGRLTPQRAIRRSKNVLEIPPAEPTIHDRPSTTILGPAKSMTTGTLDKWLFEDWQLIARALTNAEHENCQCYECDTIDALLGDIAHYWDLDDQDLTQLLR